MKQMDLLKYSDNKDKEERLQTARELIKAGEWVPTAITFPLTNGHYLITLDCYENPISARFESSNEEGLKQDGGYWFDDGISTVNDYGVIAWKPLPKRFQLKEYLERQDNQRRL